MSISGCLLDIDKLNDVSKNTVSRMSADEVYNKVLFWAEKADTDLLTEFFSRFGYGDKNSEYERTKLFTSLLKKQSEEANLKANSLCKLYNTIGLLVGVFLCIFFL